MSLSTAVVDPSTVIFGQERGTNQREGTSFNVVLKIGPSPDGPVSFSTCTLFTVFVCVYIYVDVYTRTVHRAYSIYISRGEDSQRSATVRSAFSVYTQHIVVLLISIHHGEIRLRGIETDQGSKDRIVMGI